MISSKEDALDFLSGISGKTQFNRADALTSIEVLKKISASDGLPESDISLLIEFLTTTKLASSICVNVLNCFIPETKLSKKNLEEILLWFFSEIGNDRISNALEKKFLQWLTGIICYNLGDASVVDLYYYSFLFLMKRPHLESSVCRLLCLISKPEDAKRYVVQQVLQVRNLNGSKPHINSLLSLLKSYRPDVVPERIPVTGFHYTTGFDEALKKAHARNLNRSQNENSFESESLQWNMWRIFDEKGKALTRLIPAAESLNLDDGKHNRKKIQSIMEFKTMASLGTRPLEIDIPAQTLSLLANMAGYHVLAFSDVVTKARFSYKLYHTLCRVFLFELEPYSEKEKIYFLNSIQGLQEYTHQSIPVVTLFLFKYLLIWDGEEYQQQILGLLEWIEVRDEEDLERYVLPPLRQIFISSGVHCKRLIIDTLGKLMLNLLVVDKREKNCFRNDFREYETIKSIEAIGKFVGELIVNGLMWNNEIKSRNILASALDFYDICQAVEQIGDLPYIILMPPALVYKCLFSGSRICIARLCSLLSRLQTDSVERLYSLGVFEDFANEVQKLNIYMLDCYRCLWSSVFFWKNENSFIFHHNLFLEMFWNFKDTNGPLMEKIFGIEYNSSFWDPRMKGIRENILVQLSKDYSPIVWLKEVTEKRLLQVSLNNNFINDN